MEWSVDPSTGVVSTREPRMECAFEVGDWHSFLSPGKASLHAEGAVRDARQDEGGFAAKHDVRLRTGSAIVTQRERFGTRELERHLSIEPTSTLKLGDFVARFVFDAAEFERATVDGDTFEHRGRNRYLQYPATTVHLDGPGGQVSITGDATELPEGMVLVVYARDEPPDRWVVHVRALARGSGNGFLRLYWGPVTHSELIDRVVRLLGLQDALAYYRERASAAPLLPAGVPFQYVEYADISEETRVAITAKCEYESEGGRAEG